MLQKKKIKLQYDMISNRNFVNKKTTHSYSFVHNVYTLEKKSNKLWKTGQAKVHKRISVSYLSRDSSRQKTSFVSDRIYIYIVSAFHEQPSHAFLG